jgi:type VI secretion system secreted protein Hcp
MAANMFMEIDKIPGDATEGNHKNWIVLESASFELERAVDMTDLGSNQRSHANTNFQKIELTTQIGKASNLLALAVANGTVKDSVTMHWCRSGDGDGEGLKPFALWTFKNVIIDKYSVSASADGIPEETWSLAYVGVKMEYHHTDQATGALAKENEFLWNLRSGKMETYSGD